MKNETSVSQYWFYKHWVFLYIGFYNNLNLKKRFCQFINTFIQKYWKNICYLSLKTDLTSIISNIFS